MGSRNWQVSGVRPSWCTEGMNQGENMSAEAGWYPDPINPSTHLRYWDGSAWVGDPTPRAAVRIGDAMQKTGNQMASVGCSITWIVLGVIALLVIALLIF